MLIVYFKLSQNLPRDYKKHKKRLQSANFWAEIQTWDLLNMN